MSKLKIGLTLLFSALGVFGVNEYYKPRNVRDLLKWQGVQLSSDNRVWESMLFENEAELKEKNINNHNDLWNWCEERFKSSNLSDTQIVEESRKFCSDNPTSIMARIIRDGDQAKLINKENTKAFKVNYVLTGRDEKVLKLIGIEDGKDLDKVAKRLSEWCEEQKKEKVFGQEDLFKYANFKTRCYDRGVITVSELLKKQNREPMLSGSAYEKRFKEELKKSPDLINEIKNHLNERRGELWKAWEYRKKTRTNIGEVEVEDAREKERIESIAPSVLTQEHLDNKGWEHYKWWCEKKLRSELIEEGIYPDAFGKISYRCSNPK